MEAVQRFDVTVVVLERKADCSLSWYASSAYDSET